MVNGHKHIGVPYEAHIYNAYWALNDDYEPLTDPARQRQLVNDMLSLRVNRFWNTPPTADEVLDRTERPSFHGVFEALMQVWLEKQDKPRWGEKTPQNGPYWRAISEGFPEAKFVHLIRDGRDCTLSWINANFGPKLTYPAAVKWAKYLDEMLEMKESLGPERVFELRYEDLVNQPEASLKQLCLFLGETYDPDMLDYHRREDNYMTEKRNNQNLKQPVITTNAGKWRTKMSVKNQRIFEAVAGDQLKRHGYELIHPGATVTSWQKLRDTKLLHPPLRVWSMAKNTKGWMDSLAVLRAKWRLKRSHTHPGRTQTVQSKRAA